MAMRRRTVRAEAGRETGPRKEMRRIVAARRRDSAARRPIARTVPARQDGQRVQTVRHGRVLEVAGWLRAGTHAQAHRRTTATGRQLRRRVMAAATRMAGTRTGIARISRLHARALRQEVMDRHTRMPRLTTTAEPAARTRRLLVPLPHRAATILLRRVHTRHQAGIIQLHRGRIPHQQAAVIPHLRILHRAEVIPRRAIAMVAEAAIVEEAEVAVEAGVEEVHRAVEAAREAAEARTETAHTDANRYT